MADLSVSNLMKTTTGNARSEGERIVPFEWLTNPGNLEVVSFPMSPCVCVLFEVFLPWSCLICMVVFVACVVFVVVLSCRLLVL